MSFTSEPGSNIFHQLMGEMANFGVGDLVAASFKSSQLQYLYTICNLSNNLEENCVLKMYNL